MHSKMSADKLISLERESQAIALRREGKRYDEIGKQLGVDQSTAWRLVQRAYKRVIKQNDSAADFQRKLDLDRCDTAIKALWPSVEAGKTRAVEVLMSVLKRRADLLGLDAPTKIAPTTPDGANEYNRLSDDDLHREIAKLLDAGRAREAGPADGGKALPLDATSTP